MISLNGAQIYLFFWVDSLIKMFNLLNDIHYFLLFVFIRIFKAFLCLSNFKQLIALFKVTEVLQIVGYLRGNSINYLFFGVRTIFAHKTIKEVIQQDKELILIIDLNKLIFFNRYGLHDYLIVKLGLTVDRFIFGHFIIWTLIIDESQQNLKGFRVIVF